jgi:hypothetical protein
MLKVMVIYRWGKISSMVSSLEASELALDLRGCRVRFFNIVYTLGTGLGESI